MTVTSRIDAMARGLAVRSAADEPLDRIARAMATPISRRRVFRLAAAAAGTSLFLGRTGSAHACATCPQPLDPPNWTKFCGYAVGDVGCKFVCCPPEQECCTAEGGVKCCKTDEGYECGPVVNGVPTCRCKTPCYVDCCRPNEDCVITDPEDGQGFCDPGCPAGRPRCGVVGGYGCCPSDYPCCGEGCCDSRFTCCLGESTGEHRNDTCCGRGYTCYTGRGFPECLCIGALKCGERCCPLGQVCLSERYPAICKGPQWEDLEDLLDSLKESLTSSGAAVGGSASASRTARLSAASGSPDALVAIGAVAHLGALAYDRFRSSRPDSAYRRSVKVLKPRLAPLAPGPGLDASAGRALHRLLSAEARAWALVNAAGVAQGRSLGAIRAGDTGAARNQAKAYGRFAGQAARALRRVPALRAAAVAALQAGGTPEVTITDAQAGAFQDSVRRSGLPAGMRARLTQLGLRRADQRRVAKIVLATRPRSGPVLIAPLADASSRAAVTRLAKVFKQTSARSRKQPLVSSKGRAGRVAGAPPRPHASQASGRRRRSG